VALSLKDRATDQLARQLAAVTGETLAERLERELLRRGGPSRLAETLLAIGRDCAALPDVDTRNADELAGYGDDGLWH
jgi:antitoxin VapB